MPDTSDTGRPSSATLVVGAGLVVLQIVVTTVSITSRVLNADDVWIQLWWSRWRPFSDEIALSRDTWALHAPVSIVIEQITGRGIAALALAAVVLNVVGLVLTLRFIGFLARRLGASAGRQTLAIGVVGVWLVLLSDVFVGFTARVNFRNIEIGIALLIIQLVVEGAERKGSTGRLVAVGALIGIACFNDPWFFYVGVAPVMAIIAVRWVLSKSSGPEHTIVRQLAVGSIAYALISWSFGVAGVSITNYAPPVFADVGTLADRTSRHIDLLLALFGADLSGRDLRSAETLAHLARGAVLAMVALTVWVSRRRVPAAARLPLAGMAIVAGAGLLASIVADFGPIDVQSIRFARYLVPTAAMIAIAATIPLVVADDRVRVVMAGLLGLATVTVAATIAGLAWDRATDGTDAYLLGDIRNIGDELAADGFEHGYGDFWAGMAIDYWSGDEIEISLVDCGTGRLDNSLLSPVDDYRPPTGPSFVVHLTDRPLPGCTPELLTETLGAVSSTRTTEFYTITTYDPDP